MLHLEQWISRLAGLLLVVCMPVVLHAQSNDLCIGCHEDPSLSMQRSGRDLSLHVDPKAYSASVHKDQECVSCHVGFDAGEVPHAKVIKPVDCSGCHDAGTFMKSVHGVALSGGRKGAPKCADCHTKHDIKPARAIANEIGTCLKCHNTRDILAYKKSRHFAPSLSRKNQPTCRTCHGTGHEIVSSRLAVAKTNRSNSTKLCTTCHSMTAASFKKNIHHSVLFSGAKNPPACVDCHNAHGVSSGGTSQESAKCLNCHLNPDRMGSSPNKDRLLQFAQQYVTSVHGRGGNGATCKDCHGDHVMSPTQDPAAPTRRENIGRTCGKCHAKETEEYAASSHGQALAKGMKYAPVCTDCHGEHNIMNLTNSDNPLSRQREYVVCLKCHVENEEVRKEIGISSKFIGSYTQNVHAKAMAEGNTAAATCSDCHGGHSMLRASDPASKVNKLNIAGTCGSGGCHSQARTDFDGSIHGVGLAKGRLASPTCTDCHGQHEIVKVSDPNSPVNGSNLATRVCVPCHSSVVMSEKFDIVTNPAQSYMDSYHGLAVSSGSKQAANCASCHGSHSIKPSSDPTSSINPANLKATCGKCHPNASENFVKGGVHVVRLDESSGIRYTISTMYIIMIIVVIGGMFVHNLIDFFYKATHKIRSRRRPNYEEVGHGLYLRMSVGERIQHAFLFTSFFTLVFTGFGLTYPNAWWVQVIRTVLGDWAFEARGIVHRVAAVVMIAVSLYHMYYLLFVPRGRQLLRDLLPRWSDLVNVIEAVKFYSGRSKERPRFDRFGYIEKAEYWALIWGTFVMVATGFMLWFHEFFGALTSKTVLDIAEIIHYYEAWLATLAIIVWHFYFVIFNPDIYPMNVAWLRGTITEHEMEEEHPLELERIRAAEAAKHEDAMGDEDGTSEGGHSHTIKS